VVENKIEESFVELCVWFKMCRRKKNKSSQRTCTCSPDVQISEAVYMTGAVVALLSDMLAMETVRFGLKPVV
jgi:hypothetical protein